MIREAAIISSLMIGAAFALPVNAAPSCAISGAEATRQQADLLLFGVDVGLLTSGGTVALPEGLWGATAEAYENSVPGGITEHWLYMSFGEVDAKTAFQPAIPSLSLSFSEDGILSDIIRTETPCEIGVEPAPEVIKTAVEVQNRRMSAAIDLTQRCACVTLDLIKQFANWTDSEPRGPSPAQPKSLSIPRRIGADDFGGWRRCRNPYRSVEGRDDLWPCLG